MLIGQLSVLWSFQEIHTQLSSPVCTSILLAHFICIAKSEFLPYQEAHRKREGKEVQASNSFFQVSEAGVGYIPLTYSLCLGISLSCLAMRYHGNGVCVCVWCELGVSFIFFIPQMDIQLSKHLLKRHLFPHWIDTANTSFLRLHLELLLPQVRIHFVLLEVKEMNNLAFVFARSQDTDDKFLMIIRIRLLTDNVLQLNLISFYFQVLHIILRYFER